MINDLKCAVRTLFKSPRFTLFALFTIAARIDANSAIFSAVNGVPSKAIAMSRRRHVGWVRSTRKDVSRAYFSILKLHRLLRFRRNKMTSQILRTSCSPMSVLRQLFFIGALLFLFVRVAVAGDEILEEIVEQNYPVDPNAKFTLKNDDGSIRIYGHELPEMKVQVIKKAYTKDRLKKIGVSVAVQPGNISIKTNSPPKPKWGLFDRSGTVDYIIVLPWSCDLQQVELGSGELLIDGMRGNEVNARLGSGRLFGHNCFSDVHLSVGSGDLAVGYDWWENHVIGLNTSIADGDTHLFIPSDAQFRLRAEGSDGIYNEFSTKEDRAPGEQTKIDLSIGDHPNADLKVRASDGSIKIQELYP